MAVREFNPWDTFQILSSRQIYTPNDPDQFVVGTAVSGNEHAAIFIWQTVERGANLFGTTHDRGHH